MSADKSRPSELAGPFLHVLGASTTSGPIRPGSGIVVAGAFTLRERSQRGTFELFGCQECSRSPRRTRLRDRAGTCAARESWRATNEQKEQIYQ